MKATKCATKLSIVNCQLSIVIPILAGLALSACSGEPPMPSADAIIRIGEPPRWTADPATGGTRAAIDPDTQKTTWEPGDLIDLTAEFYDDDHSEAATAQTATAIYTNQGWTMVTAISWPVGTGIAYANVTATYNTAGDPARPAFETRADGVKYGAPITISFADQDHRTLAIAFSAMTPGAAVTVAGTTADPAPSATIPAGGNLTLFVAPDPDATEIKGTVGAAAFNIFIAEEPADMLGRIYTVTPATTPGTGSPDAAAEADRFIEWAKFARTIAGSTSNFTLKADIDISHAGNWEPIGKFGTNTGFGGTFDGGGHTLSGLTIETTDTKYYQGLFGCITMGAVIANVTLKAPKISVGDGSSFTGALVGYANGATISRCGVTDGEITGNYHVGALAGTAVNTNITYCRAEATVTGAGNAGGLVGAVDASNIAACYAEGKVTATVNNAGGLAGTIAGIPGYQDAHIRFCHSHVNVTCRTGNAGGLVGEVQEGAYLYSNYATDDVEGSAALGGSLAGLNSGYIGYCCAEGRSPSGKLIGSGTGTAEVNGLYMDDVKRTILTLAGVQNLTGVRVWNSSTKLTETVTISRTIWNTDLTLNIPN